MGRPRKRCMIRGGPLSNVFKPKGIPAVDLEEVVLPLEGLEAMRLADIENMDHEAAAEKMHISRQTFGRILADARKLVSEALVMGKMIRIHGGSYVMPGLGRRGRRFGRREDR